MPGWAEAVGQRLVFFAAPSAAEVGATLIVLRERVAVSPDSARLLRRFLDACLAIFATEVARRADLAEHRAELDALCDLARAALDGDRDDRPLLARVEALLGQPGPVRFIARVPSRVVWLAAMAAEVPSEEGPAAAMLVNDLAALGLEMPLRALQAVLRD